MRIAREGIPFVVGFLLLGAGVGAGAAWLELPTWAGVLLAAPGLLLGLFSVWFFRDPDRDVPDGTDLVVSPADGRVVAVRKDPEGPSVAIFLNVFDVHVNRSPIAGRVENVTYTKGRFLAAFDERAGEHNERNEVVLTGSMGTVRVRQIAGAIARRIVCKVGPGDRLSLGQRFGLIRFGSRTDLRLPRGSTILVRVGERVKGGESLIGRLPSAQGQRAEAPEADRVSARTAVSGPMRDLDGKEHGSTHRERSLGQ